MSDNHPPSCDSEVLKALTRTRSIEVYTAPGATLAQQQAHEMHTLRKTRYSADTRNRNWLTEWASIVVSVWLSVVLVTVINNRPLSDIVLCTLLGTTTVNVLGLMYIVVKGYFPHTDDFKN